MDSLDSSFTSNVRPNICLFEKMLNLLSLSLFRFFLALYRGLSSLYLIGLLPGDMAPSPEATFFRTRPPLYDKSRHFVSSCLLPATFLTVLSFSNHSPWTPFSLFAYSFQRDRNAPAPLVRTPCILPDTHEAFVPRGDALHGVTSALPCSAVLVFPPFLVFRPRVRCLSVLARPR